MLVKKSLKALKQTGLKQLVVAGGVGANQQLRCQPERRGAQEAAPCPLSGTGILHRQRCRDCSGRLPASASGNTGEGRRWFRRAAALATLGTH